MITAASLLAAVEDARRARGLALKDVADAIGFHPALFSRLKNDLLPGQANIDALVEWLGEEFSADCAPCAEAAALAASGIDPDDVIDPEQEQDEKDPASDETEKRPVGAKVFAINAVSGKLSESEDPETAAAVARVRELLTEGAVGVSVLLDLHPDDAAIIGNAEKAADADGWEKPFREYLPDPDWTPRQRIRHTAIVDTPAYDRAKLSIAEDGTLSGPVTFEGIYTGDVRYSADPENIDLEQSLTPSPIIWDREDGDHSGMTVGYIDAFERAEITDQVSGRPVLDDEAITASLAPLDMPASYFAQTMPTGVEPLRISKPDAKGYRVISGIAAPKGICHRSAMACFTFPEDPDPQLRHFHTGTLLRLDNGKDIRVGAITMGGHHLDPALAAQGVKIDQTDNYRDNANAVFALVRAWPTRFGLMVRGVVPPDVSEATVARALACAPSVELWPREKDGKRTLLGIHIVPRPAWPVMASVGTATLAVSDEPILLDETGDDEDPAPEAAAEVVEFEGFGEMLELARKLDAKMDALTTIANTILALTPVDAVELPEE